MGKIRDIDIRYLARLRANKPERRFSFVLKHARPCLQSTANPRVLELGCGTGEFIHWLLAEHPTCAATGVDIHPSLVREARRRNPISVFRIGDIMDRKTLPGGPFDAIFMLTVHSHFPTCSRWLPAVLDLLRPGGKAFVFGLFNPEGVDVWVRARYSCARGDWLDGWSLISKETVSAQLRKKNCPHRFIDYPAMADRRASGDPLAARVERWRDGEIFYFNGLQQKLPFSLLTFGSPPPRNPAPSPAV